MSAAVDEVAGNAVSSAEASKASDEDSKHGHYQISETISSIHNLVDEVLGASNKAEGLAVQAQDISKVLSDPRHRRANQPAGAQCRHRSSARRRSRPRLCGSSR